MHIASDINLQQNDYVCKLHVSYDRGTTLAMWLQRIKRSPRMRLYIYLYAYDYDVEVRWFIKINS